MTLYEPLSDLDGGSFWNNHAPDVHNIKESPSKQHDV